MLDSAGGLARLQSILSFQNEQTVSNGEGNENGSGHESNRNDLRTNVAALGSPICVHYANNVNIHGNGSRHDHNTTQIALNLSSLEHTAVYTPATEPQQTALDVLKFAMHGDEQLNQIHNVQPQIASTTNNQQPQTQPVNPPPSPDNIIADNMKKTKFKQEETVKQEAEDGDEPPDAAIHDPIKHDLSIFMDRLLTKISITDGAMPATTAATQIKPETQQLSQPPHEQQVTTTTTNDQQHQSQHAVSCSNHGNGPMKCPYPCDCDGTSVMEAQETNNPQYQCHGGDDEIGLGNQHESAAVTHDREDDDFKDGCFAEYESWMCPRCSFTNDVVYNDCTCCRYLQDDYWKLQLRDDNDGNGQSDTSVVAVAGEVALVQHERNIAATKQCGCDINHNCKCDAQIIQDVQVNIENERI